MPATVNGGGDQLARGAVRVQFRTAQGVSDEKWNDIFGDFDPEAYKNAPNPAQVRQDVDLQEAGDTVVMLTAIGTSVDPQ